MDTLSGRMHVRWDEGAAATPHGQLVYFAEFLATTGIFDQWVVACPLTYRSGNAPDKRDVQGTLVGSLGRTPALRAHDRPAWRCGITVLYWRDEAAIAAWKRQAEHLHAQHLGRSQWYAHYELRVARVERAYGGSAA